MYQFMIYIYIRIKSLLRNIIIIAIQYITTVWYCMFIPNPQKSYSWFKTQNTYHTTSFCMCIYIYIYVCIHISNRINNNPPQRYSRNLFDFDISHHWPPLTHRAIDQALPVLVSLLLLGICNEPSLELDSQDAGCHHMICVEHMPMVTLYII